jgi:C-terminal processing protease CtpA/Prc
MAPAGCERIRLSLKKPLGLVLEANKAGEIYVVEVVPEGSAAKDGRIEVGDQLISTSAIVYTSEDDYGGVSVKTGQKMVRLLVRGEKFDTGACAALRARMRLACGLVCVRGIAARGITSVALY